MKSGTALNPLIVLVSGLLLLQGCAAPPTNPTVAVMPGAGKSFETFAMEQATCKQYASTQVAGQAEQANTLGAGGAVLGTLLGAGLGAAIGGGRGAAIGAATGALGGTGVAAAGTANAQVGIQQQYDIAYVQCMAAKGNQTPDMQPASVAAVGPVYAVGSWRWFNPDGSDVDIRPDGTTLHYTNGQVADSGTWAPLTPTGMVQINWSSGWIDRWQVSADGQSMTGSNQNGGLPAVYRSAPAP